MSEYKVYCDGAYSSLRDQGGWAFVVIKEGIQIKSSCGDVCKTTNNRMEIQAALEAIKWAKENSIFEFSIVTDSMYLIGTQSKGWKKNKNLDLWVEIEEAKQGLTVSWEHVKGHSGDTYNELCDTLALHASHIEQLEL